MAEGGLKSTQPDFSTLLTDEGSGWGPGLGAPSWLEGGPTRTLTNGSNSEPKQRTRHKGSSSEGLGFWDSVSAQEEDSSMSRLLILWAAPRGADMRPGSFRGLCWSHRGLYLFSCRTSGPGRTFLQFPLSFQDPAPHRGHCCCVHTGVWSANAGHLRARGCPLLGPYAPPYQSGAVFWSQALGLELRK